MKKTIFLLLLILWSGVVLQAQVKIGGTVTDDVHKSAILELESTNKGLLLSRVSLANAIDKLANSTMSELTGMIVYNTNTVATTDNAVTPGFYYNTGTRWEKLALGYTNWFYMPSIPIDISQNRSNVSLNLYDLYKKQFSGGTTLNGTNVPLIKNNSAPAVIPFFPNPTDLNYYITYHDPNVFKNITIGNDGVMRYSVDITGVSEHTYINIVFVIK